MALPLQKKRKGVDMTEATTKVPVKTEKRTAEPTSALRAWQPFEGLRREVDRLFEDFDQGFWRSPFRSALALEPFWRTEMTWPAAPAVDITESDKAYEITADLPGISEKDIEVKLACRRPGHQRSQAGREGREAEGLLSSRAPFRLVRTHLPRPGRRRCR